MAATFDLEEALNIVEANDGVGAWEDGEDSPQVTRWLFPRFDGADEIGTCEVDKATHEGNHKQMKSCKGFSPDPGNMYLTRSGLGPYDSDVETVCAWLAAPRNIVGAVLVLGEPGTGKTALLEAAVTHMDRDMTTVVCTPDHTKDSLFLRFVGEGNGDPGRDGAPTPFTLGPIPYAAKHGHVLYLDEFMLLMDGVKPLVYPLADGRRFLPEGNVDGSPLEIHPDFRLVLSSNPLVRGASLPEPIGSRCASTTITVETSVEMLHALGIDDSIIAAWQAMGNDGLWRPQIRELRLADYWMGVDLAQAASAMIPEHCPESQRKQVRDIVVGFLGADIREDGRLVVK